MKIVLTLSFLGILLQNVWSGRSFQSSSFTSVGNNNIIINRHAGSNPEEEEYISISSPNIKIDGDYFSCSTLVCPKNTIKCLVVSEAVPEDENKMKTISECLDAEKNVLERKEYLENNPYPGIKPPYSRFSTVDRNGNIKIEDSNGQNVFNSNKMTKEQEIEMMNQINRENQRFQETQRQMQLHFQEQMKNLEENMKNTFGNNFPFGNQAFPFVQNSPVYSPAFYTPNFYFPSSFPSIPYPYYPYQSQQAFLSHVTVPSTQSQHSSNTGNHHNQPQANQQYYSGLSNNI